MRAYLLTSCSQPFFSPGRKQKVLAKLVKEFGMDPNDLPDAISVEGVPAAGLGVVRIYLYV